MIYTMLVGKPPFETSQVRQTYKRIRSLDYHIPEEANLSDEAAGLIHRILVANPNKRPSLEEIMKDRFMNKNSIPPSLPTRFLLSRPGEDFIKKYSFSESLKLAKPIQESMIGFTNKISLESTGPTTSEYKPPCTLR
eukprot:TRINITY_DN8187_c0_g1_i2.p1 TRINITY_DN8187_c0_g1~~TRINITY_DN8187_c0_g1_i2.p1  ORF type:complete len:137 (+),score=17.47 TRINITY_DN8187_c0_g1_i2:792-1202(+)